MPIAGCGAAPTLNGPPPRGDVDRRTFVADEGRFAALRAPGQVIYWNHRPDGGMDPQDLGEAPDAIEVALPSGALCALRAGGEVVCRADPRDGLVPGPRLDAPAWGAARRIAASGPSLCVQSPDGAIRCGVPGRAELPVVLSAAPEAAFDAADGLVCAGGRGAPVTCAAVGSASTGAPPVALPELSDAVRLRVSGLLACGVAPSGRLRCVSQPHPHGGFGSGAPFPRPEAELRLPEVEAVASLEVTWATVCARPAEGDWRCDGLAQGEPIDTHHLRDLSGVDRLALVDSEIGCGLDDDGALRVSDRARGFCGEEALVRDAAGRDLVEARRAGYSAEISPRARAGLDFGSGATGFAGGFGLPLVFGSPEGLRMGPLLDVATQGFDTVEPGGGATLEYGEHVRLGLDARGAQRFGGGPPVAVLTGAFRVGGAVQLMDPNCRADCGLRWVPTGAFSLAYRAVAAPGGERALLLAFEFDPAVIAGIFALATADWRF